MASTPRAKMGIVGYVDMVNERFYMNKDGEIPSRWGGKGVLVTSRVYVWGAETLMLLLPMLLFGVYDVK